MVVKKGNTPGQLPRPKAIFFDLDETLLCNRLEGKALFATLFRRHLTHLDDNALPSFMDALYKHAQATWNSMFETELSADQQMVACFTQAMDAVGRGNASAEAMFHDFADYGASHTDLNINAVETIRQLKQLGFAVGIITNGVETIQMAKIQRHNLQLEVDQVIVSEHARAHKPSSKVFNFALKKLNVTPENAWHVGDSVTNDIVGAMNSGLTGVFYDPEKTGQQQAFANVGFQPDVVIHNFKELLALLT